MRKLFILFIGLTLASGASARVWYVDPATNTIQERLDAASNGDEVVVRDGEYTGEGNRNLDFHGKRILLRSENGASKTAIDCLGIGRAFTIHSGETTNTIIRGFTIVGANTAITNVINAANYTLLQYGPDGSAIYCKSKSGFTLDSCDVMGNQAMTYQATTFSDGGEVQDMRYEADGSGGAIRCEGCDMVIRNSRILDNRAGWDGGGIYLASNASARIENSVIENNAAAMDWELSVITIDSGPFKQQATLQAYFGGGGGIFAEDSRVALSNVVVSGNFGGAMGGGACLLSGSHLVAAASRFLGNYVGDSSVSRGGGLYADHSALCFSDGEFSENRARVQYVATEVIIDSGVFRQQSDDLASAGRGAGLFMSGATGTVARTQFRANVAAEAGGAVAAVSNSALCMTACSFESNRASSAIQKKVTELNVVTADSFQSITTVYSNETGGAGAGLFASDSSLNLTRGVFRANAAGTGACVYAGTGAAMDLADALLVNNDSFASTETTLDVTPGGTSTTFAVAPGSVDTVLHAEACDVRLRNCTAYRNAGVPGSNGLHAALGAKVTLWNDIVWSNSLVADSGTTVHVASSCVQGGYPGIANFAANPRLTPDGRLTAASPCIDAGIVAGAPLSDFEGEPRVDDSAHKNRFSIVDIGADEFVDVDHDGMADAWETAMFGNRWRKSGFADTDRDGVNDRGEYVAGTNPNDPHSGGLPASSRLSNRKYRP